MSYLPSTDFTPEEALSLLVLCYNLGHRRGRPVSRPGPHGGHEARKHAAPRSCAIICAKPATPFSCGSSRPVNWRWPASNYDQLISAITSRRCVRIEYDSFSDGERIHTKLSPYRLLFSRRSWYVFGRSSLHRQTRTFHLGRIHQLEPLNERFRFPRGFSIDRQLRNAWHLIPEPGPDQHVVVRFEKLVARNVAEVAWHKTQKLVWRKDGRLDFHVKVSGIHEISWWILGYGDQAEVLRPIELRRLIAARSRGMANRYRDV